jgi:hypothetical protein
MVRKIGFMLPDDLRSSKIVIFTDPDVQISCFRFFMEELRSRWCKGHQP